jgi:ABC-type Fe3+-siderophore transport system permease subunit
MSLSSFMTHNFRLAIFLHGVIVAASVVLILEIRPARLIALALLGGGAAVSTLLLAKTMRRGLATLTLSALTGISCLAISAVVYMFIVPTRSEGESYIFAEAILLLVILVACILPLAFAGWIVRFQQHPHSARAT